MARKYQTVPELSLKAFTDGGAEERATFQEALFEGFKYFGFIILKDHNVDGALLKRAYQLSAKFFAFADNYKKQFFRKDGQRGYTPLGREHARDSKYPDIKEFWHVGREFNAASPLSEIYPPNMWPDKPIGFRDTFLQLYDALEESGHIMLEALAPSLDVDAEYFRRMATNGNSILRLLHYPPISDDADPNCVRAAAHEDINLITILVAANGSGLQLLTREGEWLSVETAPENLIVDAGDMLARVCNDVIPATTHRVVNPDGPNQSRYSMPFFMHPHPGALLSCLESCKDGGVKYPEITAGAFLKERLSEIGLAS